MDRILFGDNQFFGVNHMSEEKARSQAMRFQSIESIIEVLSAAYDNGIRTFMCTTHDRLESICKRIKDSQNGLASLKIYPCMPYAHKYANAVTEEGLIGAIKRFTPKEGLFDAIVRSGVSLATRDIEGLATLLVDAEMKMLEGLDSPVIFLQNVVVDLLLGLGLKEVFRIFSDHVSCRYGAEPGFITMNLPMLLGALDDVGVQNPIVCSNMNKIGFRMCGGLDAYEQCLRTREFRAIAMSVFASGAIPPREAIEWVCRLPNVQSILFGASSRGNIANTCDLISRYWS